SDFLRYRIQNTGALFPSQTPLLRAPSVAEQALESHPRIHFRGKRLRGRCPGYAVGVCTAVTPVAVTEIAVFLDPQLDGFQDGVTAIFLGDQLIDRHSQVRT